MKVNIKFETDKEFTPDELKLLASFARPQETTDAEMYESYVGDEILVELDDIPMCIRKIDDDETDLIVMDK